ncbi:unnamed protein product [Larinioides sclopetarius]|uniref:Trans-1,2-dihydrobenzene-1,2-diol dehydrogenase n=1 Tax=Larinioides sclopetarius TaxID=280406 RepID=A0AAV2A3J4_9ARAC
MATKWGVVSAGKISNDFVAAVKGMCGSEHEFIAVAARNSFSAKSFASKHCISKAYGSYEELANDQEIEVVYIGSVNSQHFPLAKLMLENGKHVLLEKPMTLNLKQTRALGEIARKNKLFLMEVPDVLYVATKIETKDGVVDFPLPKPTAFFNYPDSTGLAYEAIEVRECIKHGHLESIIMPLKDSELLAEIMDSIRHQVGVLYPEENAM